MTDTTDPREGGSEHAELLRDLNLTAKGIARGDPLDAENAVRAIRALEAKVRKAEHHSDKLDKANRRLADEVTRLSSVDRERGRLAGEVERLTGGVEFWRGSHAKVTEANARLTSERDALKECVTNALWMLRDATGTTGECMCGSPVDGHGWSDNHAPVDTWDVAREQFMEIAGQLVGDAARRADEGE